MITGSDLLVLEEDGKESFDFTKFWYFDEENDENAEVEDELALCCCRLSL